MAKQFLSVDAALSALPELSTGEIINVRGRNARVVRIPGKGRTIQFAPAAGRYQYAAAWEEERRRFSRTTRKGRPAWAVK